MHDNIALTGVVATQPVTTHGADGFIVTNFRIASNQRRYDSGQHKYVDAPTNFYGVAVYGSFGENVGTSVNKGEHVLIAGKLRVSEWRTSERAGTNVDVIADAVGHDLRWGKTVLTRRTLISESRPHPDEPSLGEEAPSPRDGIDELARDASPDELDSDAELVSAGADGDGTPF
jgi:single-strand DNA-binding protein